MRTHLLHRLTASSVDPGDGNLPSEFRIFNAGVNTSTHGSVTFTEASAKSVMDEYRLHGAQLPLDLEHLALDPDAPNFRSDAMAWFDLAVRKDAKGQSELWAVNVKWTPEGERRLREKSQRYTSPAFFTNAEGEVVRVVNVALTSLPASDGLVALTSRQASNGGLQALIAASGRRAKSPQKRNAMDPDSMDVAKIAEGMGLDLKGLAKALGLDPAATMEDITAALQIVSDKLGKIVGLAPAPAAEEPASEEPAAAAATTEEEPATNADAPAEEDEAELKAARMVLLRDTSTKTTSEALSVVAKWKKAFADQEDAKAKLAKERATLEAAERRSIGAALVKSGLAPAMVWADPLAKVPTLAPLLQGQTIEYLRAYAGRANAQPTNAQGSAKPPSGNAHGLSDRELQICSQMKTDPAVYAANKARIEQARAARSQ